MKNTVDACMNVNVCNNVQIVKGQSKESENAEFDTFISYFDFDQENLSDVQCGMLKNCLFKHRDIFVTKENPSLGFTSLVEHTIHLKPNAVSKHHKPYRLSPDKREVLRTQLTELLNQGIITPVNEKEDIPISSPIVLVSKRRQPNSGKSTTPQEAHLSSYRFCCDFRYLNSQTQPFRYTIPNLQELIESLNVTHPNFITSIDLSSGFFQMGIAKDSTKYTAFNTCFGTYKFLRLPMGLSTSPNSFQLLMDKLLRGLTYKSVLCYLDDVIVCSNTFEKHLSDLCEVFQRFKDAGLKLNPTKCTFARDQCVFLGHHISKDGIRPPSVRLDVIRSYPTPTSQKQLRRAMGLFNWFRKFIPRFSDKAYPLNLLLKKGVRFVWTQDHQRAFDDIKAALVNSDALAFPDYDREFRLAVDTSSRGLGYMLYQIHQDGTRRVVRFGSKGLNKYQQSYGPTKLELLGMVYSVLDCASYLRGRHFVVECDHQALQPLFQKQLHGAIYERWIAILQQFDLAIEYKPATQMQVPDALSRCHPHSDLGVMDSSPVEEDPYFPYMTDVHTTGVKLPSGKLLSEVLKETNKSEPEVNRISLLTENLANPKFDYDADTEDVDVILSKHRKTRRLHTRGKTRVFQTAKSMCEDYTGLKINVDTCEQINTDTDTCANISSENSDTCEKILCDKTDTCAEPVNEICDELSISTELETRHNPLTLTTEIDDIRELESEPHLFTIPNNDTSTEPVVQNNFYQITTEISSDEKLEEQADKPLDGGGISFPDNIPCCEIFQHTTLTRTSVRDMQRNDNYYKLIIDYLQNDNLPDGQKEARRIILESADYAIIGDLLFHSRVAKSKRTKAMCHYQLALPQDAIPVILQLYHDSLFSGHCGIQETLDRIREHYFFPKMTVIISDYVKSCSKCQARKLGRTAKPSITAFPTPTKPFDVWELDLYGPLPVTPSGKSYIFTAVDLFSKYLFTMPIANSDALSVGVAIFHLVCTFGVCSTFISDRGSEFVAKATKETCKLLQIHQDFTPSYAHNCLGACERGHHVLATKLTPYMNDRRNNWEDLLPAIVFSMNASVNSTCGYSPYEIVYGHRPKFPLSGVPLDMQTFPKDIHDYMQSLKHTLSAVHADMLTHIQTSQTKMTDSVNAKSHPTSFSVGDYVYLQSTPIGTGQKLQELFKGPYVVKETVTAHLVILFDPSTQKTLDKPIHINRLKYAYVRAPTPTNYFQIARSIYKDQAVQTSSITQELDEPSSTQTITDSVLPEYQTSSSQESHSVSSTQSESPVHPSADPHPAPTVLPRPRRTIRKPLRYQDNCVNPSDLSSSDVCSPNILYKVKRILAQRGTGPNVEYLVHFVGEPSQKATWVKFEDLNDTARNFVKSHQLQSVVCDIVASV
ncbi:uncharacterized protein LOC134248836 [Saccostrea cucullata]|uniref:uncharacterized protein LOC134248836 n=1 Tax=Saccostrea cuccullata TaxID=36930 RepID=UPI002ED1B227